MQAAGMLRGAGAMFILVSLAFLIGHANTLPLQFLAAIPGYIPVYIRHGDQPLEEINPALAEAFHETSTVPKGIHQIESDNHAAHVTSDSKDRYESKKRQGIDKLPTYDDNSNANSEPEEEESGTIPKLVSAYELNNQKTQKDSKRKPVSSEDTAFKIRNQLNREKEGLDLLAELRKEELGPNEVLDINPNYPELPSEVPRYKKIDVRNFAYEESPPIQKRDDGAHRESNVRLEKGGAINGSESEEESLEADSEADASSADDSSAISKDESEESKESYRRRRASLEDYPVY